MTAFLAGRDFILAPYERIEFTELPKTVSGKIRQVGPRAREQHRRATDERGALELFEDDVGRPRSAV